MLPWPVGSGASALCTSSTALAWRGASRAIVPKDLRLCLVSRPAAASSGGLPALGPAAGGAARRALEDAAPESGAAGESTLSGCEPKVPGGAFRRSSESGSTDAREPCGVCEPPSYISSRSSCDSVDCCDSSGTYRRSGWGC
eukprot:7390212-Prymnesium_polylepis.2